MTRLDIAVEESPAVDVRYEELGDIVGRRYVGPWFTVDRDHTERFEWASYFTDRGPDGPQFEQEAQANIVEGFHLLGLLEYLSNGLVRTEPTSIFGWNYGINRARFVSPVTVHDRIRLDLLVSRVDRRLDATIVTFDCVVELEGSHKPAFIAEWLTYYRPVK